MTKPSEIDKLRREIAKTAEKIHRAYWSEDWPSFHLQLGKITGLGYRLYEENAKAERET